MTKEVTTIETEIQSFTSQPAASVMFDISKFEQAQRVAKMLMTSDLVPAQYQGNIGNCVIALDLASRLNVHPLMLMQNTYVVHGKPGLEGKFIIALLNGSGQLSKRLEWKFNDEKNPTECTCIAVTKDGQTLEETLTWDVVKSFKWDQNRPWQQMPKKMFQYRTATFLARSYFPDLLMGMQTVEELKDIEVEALRPTLPKPKIEKAIVAKAPIKENTEEPLIEEPPVKDEPAFELIALLDTREIQVAESGELISLDTYSDTELELIGTEAQKNQNKDLYKLIADEFQRRSVASGTKLKETKKVLKAPRRSTASTNTSTPF